MTDRIDRNAQRIYHILQQAATIRRRISGLSAAEFFANTDKTDATLYGLTVIGEAVRAMDDAFKAAHPDIPWRAIVGMRNFIVHEYEGIDYSRVWETVTESLPSIVPLLVEIYNAFEFPPDFTPPPPPEYPI